MSKRFMLERFLGLSKDEIEKNEQMWREERDKPELQTTQGQDLRSIGITPAGMETDIATGEEMANLQAPGAEGGLPAAPAGGVGGTLPGAGAPAAAPAGL
jgi:hypothetical protein